MVRWSEESVKWSSVDDWGSTVHLNTIYTQKLTLQKKYFPKKNERNVDYIALMQAMQWHYFITKVLPVTHTLLAQVQSRNLPLMVKCLNKPNIIIIFP